LCRRLIGVSTRTHCGVAGAEDDDVAVEDACCIDLAACDHVGCPREGFDRQERIGRSGGSELCVGGWSKEASVIKAIERLAIECSDADAEVSVAECGVGEDGLNALSE
jgi:hypothetical protein